MCQQSLEKLAKGLYNYYIDDDVPRVHNIYFIIDKVLNNLNNVQIDGAVTGLFDKLSAYYLQGRYPSFIEKMSVLVIENEAREILKQSKEAFSWMKSLKT